MGRDRNTRILGLRKVGWTQARIGRELGLTQSGVSYVLRKNGVRSNQRPRRAARRRALVEDFLADPSSLPPDVTLSPGTCELLLQECMKHADSNHVVARPKVEETLNLFAARMEEARARRRDWEERRFRCHYVQALGLLAFCDRKSSRLAEAESRLREAIARDCRGCVACLADLHRRLGIVLVYQRRFDEALAALTTALELYRKVRGTGHDLHGLPREKCLAARAKICVYSERFELAESDATAALPTVPAAKRGLRLQLLETVAWSQLRLPGRFAGSPHLPAESRVASAKETLFEAVALFDAEDLDESHSAERASVYWLSGVIDGLEGNRTAAEFKLGVARDDLRAIPMPDQLVICAADLAAFAAASPRQAQAKIAGSVSWPETPEYLSVYRDHLHRVMEPGLPPEELGRRLAELRGFAEHRAA